MGDVAMTVPVIRNLLQEHPDLSITFVSNAFFQPLFEGIERCHFHPAYLKDKHKGITGINRLFKEIRKLYAIHAVADLHSVLRSTLLRSLFRLRGYKTAVINKGRKEKKELTQKEHKVLKQLTTSYERYANVFRELGLEIKLDSSKPVFKKRKPPEAAQMFFTTGKKVIAVAPFAQHLEKMYPLERMKQVVSKLVRSHDIQVLLLGGGKEEAAILQQWENEIPGVYNVAGKFSYKEELAIISNCRLVVSMDSANMHLASLYKVPVVSIWGATHPFAGFYGWGQDENNIVQEELYCRPCSVFGNKPCYRGDHACMQMITEEKIINKIISLLPHD